jgi:hypothetical protein
MRRTAWNHIWIPYDQIGLESLKSASPPAPVPAQQPPASAPTDADKGVLDVVAPTADNEPVGPDATWGIPDQGLKVWLRRTFIFQLMSVPERY